MEIVQIVQLHVPTMVAIPRTTTTNMVAALVLLQHAQTMMAELPRPITTLTGKTSGQVIVLITIGNRKARTNIKIFATIIYYADYLKLSKLVPLFDATFDILLYLFSSSPKVTNW